MAEICGANAMTMAKKLTQDKSCFKERKWSELSVTQVQQYGGKLIAYDSKKPRLPLSPIRKKKLIVPIKLKFQRTRPSCFLGSGPKGPMSCRTQGWISICPPPWSFSSLKFPSDNMENCQNANFPLNNMEKLQIVAKASHGQRYPMPLS